LSTTAADDVNQIHSVFPVETAIEVLVICSIAFLLRGCDEGSLNSLAKAANYPIFVPATTGRGRRNRRTREGKIGLGEMAAEGDFTELS
jgi:hypothetical protein